MRLGSCWGLTAPMLCILVKENGVSVLEPAIDFIKVDRQIVSDVRTELLFLKKAISSVPKEYSIDGGVKPLNLFDPKIRFVNGKLYGEIDESDFYISFVSHFLVEVLKDHFRVGTEFYLDFSEQREDFENRIAIIEQVKSAIQKEDFYLGDARKILRKLKRKFKASEDTKIAKEDSTFSYEGIASVFSLKSEVKSSFFCGGKSVSFNPDEIKIVEYFVDSLDTIEKLDSMVLANATKDAEVFGVRFRDLIQYKPTYLYYRVQSKFDLIKSKHGSVFLERLVQDMSEASTHFQNLLKSEVITDTELENRQLGVGKDFWEGKLKDFGKEKRAFFTEAGVDLDRVTPKNFAIISSVYDLVSQLTIDGLNSIFGVEFSVSEWDSLIEKLNCIGVCGVNLFSLKLLEKEIGNLIFVPSEFIVKTKEEIETFEMVVSDIDAMLSTIKPIGSLLTRENGIP